MGGKKDMKRVGDGKELMSYSWSVFEITLLNFMSLYFPLLLAPVIFAFLIGVKRHHIKITYILGLKRHSKVRLTKNDWGLVSLIRLEC